MSKVRRERHKNLVFWRQIGKTLNKVETHHNIPRWRQLEKAEDERIFKKWAKQTVYYPSSPNYKQENTY